jgi:CubicO group peptidase (beta-lactamase class C family)
VASRLSSLNGSVGASIDWFDSVFDAVLRIVRNQMCSVVFLCFVMVPNCTIAKDGDYVKGATGESIREFVELVHERLGFSGVVLAGRDGNVVAEIARGESDATTKKQLHSSTLFEIASCTKSFTAIAILRLAEEGKLSLDDLISKHLPGIPSNCNAITIRHLLMHTSGIPGSNTSGSGDDVTKVIPTFLSGGPKVPPGQRHEYWNQGYALLSEIVARASDRPYTDSLRALIFDPCQMHVTRFTGDSASGDLDVAVGLSTRGASRSALEHPYGSYGFQYRGTGGIVTNIQDLWKWDRALADGKLLTNESLREMVKPGPGDYALGWKVRKATDGTDCHYHSGGVRGFVSQIQRIPSIDGALFLLSNQEDTLPLTILQEGIERILFGKPVDIVLPSAPDPKLLTGMMGEYIDSKNRKLVIAKGTGLPTVRVYWGGPVTNGYLGIANDGQLHLFILDMADRRIRFKDDGALKFSPATERATSVSMMGLTPPLVFER